MALAQRTDSASLDLSNPTDPGFISQVMEVAGLDINYSLNGVKKDVAAWLIWMLTGGVKLRRNKRSEKVNAYGIMQDTLCLALEPFYDDIDWSDPLHFALIERATRPLNQALRV